jgi:hypothetical protein
VYDFIHATNGILESRGVKLPLEGQPTTSPVLEDHALSILFLKCKHSDKLKSKKRNSGRSWLKRSVLTFSCSLMLLFFIFILSSCTQEDTIGAGKNVIESEYSEETGEMYNHLTTVESHKIIPGKVSQSHTGQIVA